MMNPLHIYHQKGVLLRRNTIPTRTTDNGSSQPNHRFVNACYYPNRLAHREINRRTVSPATRHRLSTNTNANSVRHIRGTLSPLSQRISTECMLITTMSSLNTRLSSRILRPISENTHAFTRSSSSNSIRLPNVRNRMIARGYLNTIVGTNNSLSPNTHARSMAAKRNQ